MSDKYFRIMQTPSDWKPYRLESMYDEAPQYGSYESTSGVDKPIEGDYIIVDENGTRVKASSFERDLDHVEFHAMPALSDLLRNHEIIEVPESLAQLDCNMKYEITSLNRELLEAEDAITTAEHRLSDPNVEPEEIKSLKSWCSECRQQFSKLSANLDTLQAEYQTKVITALPVKKSPKSEKIIPNFEIAKTDKPTTVREMFEHYSDAHFDMMTPGGYVYITSEDVKELFAGNAIKGNPGTHNYSRSITAEELLNQKILNCSYDKGVWHILSEESQKSEQSDKIHTWLQNAINSASRDVEMGYQQEDLEL